MRKRFTKIALSAALALAMAFTFSCSSGDDGGDGNSAQLSSSSANSGDKSSSSVNGSSSSGSSSSSVVQSSSSSVVVSSSSVLSSSSMNVFSSSSTLSSSSVVTNVVYGTPVTYEGETYQTVVIGTQTWMAENLNYDVSGSVCYGNDPANCATYGRLYDWATAMDLPVSCNSRSCASQITTPHRGICPSGWHIPSYADWNVLMKFVNPSCSNNSSCAGAGTKLKARDGWEPYSGVPAGTDEFGFAALPGGGGFSGGSFDYVGYRGYWWSATEELDYAYYRLMGYGSEYALYYGINKYNLFSVRCLQD